MIIQPGAGIAATPQANQAGGQRSDAVSTAVASAQTKRAQATGSSDVPQNQSVKAAQEVDRKTLESALTKVEKFIAPMNSSLSFSIDEKSGVRIVRVIDNETKEVIRQMPSEEMVAIAAALESLQGLLVKQQA